MLKAVQLALFVASPFRLQVVYHFQGSTGDFRFYDVRSVATYYNACKVFMVLLQESIKFEKDIVAFLEDIG